MSLLCGCAGRKSSPKMSKLKPPSKGRFGLTVPRAKTATAESSVISDSAPPSSGATPRGSAGSRESSFADGLALNPSALLQTNGDSSKAYVPRRSSGAKIARPVSAIIPQNGNHRLMDQQTRDNVSRLADDASTNRPKLGLSSLLSRQFNKGGRKTTLPTSQSDSRLSSSSQDVRQTVTPSFTIPPTATPQYSNKLNPPASRLGRPASPSKPQSHSANERKSPAKLINGRNSPVKLTGGRNSPSPLTQSNPKLVQSARPSKLSVPQTKLIKGTENKSANTCSRNDITKNNTESIGADSIGQNIDSETTKQVKESKISQSDPAFITAGEWLFCVSFLLYLGLFYSGSCKRSLGWSDHLLDSVLVRSWRHNITVWFHGDMETQSDFMLCCPCGNGHNDSTCTLYTLFLKLATP